MKWYGRRVRVMTDSTTYPQWVDALVPVDALSLEALQKIPEGATARVEASVPRDGGRHRYLMKLFDVAHKALPEEWPTMSYDTFRQALMLDAGFYDVAATPDGMGGIVESYVPWSLEYSAMDDITHKMVVDGVIKCLVTRWIPGLESEAFEGAVLEAIG